MARSASVANRFSLGGDPCAASFSVGTAAEAGGPIWLSAHAARSRAGKYIDSRKQVSNASTAPTASVPIRPSIVADQ